MRMLASWKPSGLLCVSHDWASFGRRRERLTWRPLGSSARHELSTLMFHSLDTAAAGTTGSPGRPPFQAVLESWRTWDVLPGRAGQVRFKLIVVLLSPSSWFALARLRRLQPAPGRVLGCRPFAGHRCGRQLRFPRGEPLCPFARWRARGGGPALSRTISSACGQGSAS